jgi:hypothetical protein
VAVSKEKTFERIKANCKVMPNGCWEWQKFRHPKPRHYGGTGWNGKSWHTHRLTYVLVKGHIPAGMVVMHSCDNPPCCNPDHLSLGTHLQNMADCRARGRYYYANLTHCKHGHEFNEENTYYIKTPGPSFGLRKCKACSLRITRELYHRDVAAARARAKMYRERRKAKLAGSCSETVLPGETFP